MVKTRAEQILEHRESLPPQASPLMAKSVSHIRRESLENELEQGHFRESANFNPTILEPSLGIRNKRSNAIGSELTSSGVVRGSSDIFRAAQATPTSPVSSGAGGAGGVGGNGFRGSGSTIRQVSEVYSPLWLNSNLNLPRDRATINAWSRSFFALNPIVHNAITLHSTYPIAKLNIKCKNQKVERFFAEMTEELDLMTLCSQIAQEFWVLGEAFVYAELDERTAKWSRLLIQNPDYITVKRSVIAGEPIISLRPDENLRRMIFSQRPSDIQQRQQLDPAIIEHVKRGDNIPLNNFYVSHLARKISPYEVRGSGVIISNFRALMLLDKFRECHDEETEVLTDQGFKKYQEVIDYEMVMDGTYNQPYVTCSKPKAGIKIACFNPENEELEYHEPSNAHVSHHSGDMYHFCNEKIDLKVTGEHDLWVSEKKYEYSGHRSLRKTYWDEYKKIKAQDLRLNDFKRFRSQIKWAGDDSVKTVDVCGKDVPIELYLEFLGYLISEGSIYSNGKSRHIVEFCQAKDKYLQQFKDCAENFSKAINKSYASSTNKPSNPKHLDWWSAAFCGKNLYNHFKEAVQDDNGNVHAEHKKVPRWIMDLSPRLLNIFLDALVRGDGSVHERNHDKNSYHYYTTSKQLSDDVYEIAYKCGYVPTVFVRNDEKYLAGKESVNRKLPLYTLGWSNCGPGNFPNIYKTSRNSQTKEKHDTFKLEKYDGMVWCFEVPTGLFITRRNGKITIQGNCKFVQADNLVNPLTLIKIGSDEFRPTPTDLEAWRNVFVESTYDKDFKIFTHNAVTVERVGASQGIYDTSGDVTQLIKELFIGLMVPSVIMDGSDTTYATGSVALDVLRQRYMQFRNMLGAWLKRKIFAPIAKLNDFYEYIDGEKKLIVPEIEWNHMSLFDMSDYIQNLSTLATGEGTAKKLSLQTLYRSLGVDYEDEQRKIRYEDIQDTIRTKELASLQLYPLNELRALTPRDEIEEKEPDPEAPLPGETVPGEGGGEPMELGKGALSMPPPPAGAKPDLPVGRPKGIGSPQQNGGNGIGPGGVPKPAAPT